MRLFQKVKDGGPDSHVWAYTLIELKDYFSIILLKFEDGSRDAYHTHAFNAWSWLFKGYLAEFVPVQAASINTYLPSFKPIFTPKDRMHQVVSRGTSWVLTFRGPWDKQWDELTKDGHVILTHGRQVV